MLGGKVGGRQMVKTKMPTHSTIYFFPHEKGKKEVFIKLIFADVLAYTNLNFLVRVNV